MPAATADVAPTIEQVGRGKVLLSAALPIGRALGRTPGPAIAAAGAVPVLWTLARGGTDLRFATIVAALVGSSALAGAVEDAAATTTAPGPTTRLAQRVLRLAMLAACVAVSWAACAVAAAVASVSIDEPGRLVPVGLATAGLALAVASAMADDAERGAGSGAGVGGSLGAILVVLTSTAMNQRLPVFPTLVDLDGDRTAWWAAAIAAWAATAWLNRDPAARRPRFRP